jgi:hypothetical protein
MWSVFTMYGAVFIYLADVYGPFASSALAGQSLARNIAGTAFPLFINQVYDALGFPWGNTLFALLGAVLAPVPFVRASGPVARVVADLLRVQILFYFGPRLRAKSKFASAIRHD